MTTSAGGTSTIKKICPGPAEMIMHFYKCQATNDDVVTIPNVTYVHYALAVANATSHGGAAALSEEALTIEQATYLNEVKFTAGGDEYVNGFSISDIDDADDCTGAGTAASSITYYKVAPGPSDGYVSSGVSDGGMIVAYFEAVVTSNEAISFHKVGINKVLGCIARSISSGAHTAAECTLGDADELHKVQITTGALSDADVRGIVWGYSDDSAKAANTGTTLTEATGVKIYKLFPGPSEANLTYFKNTEVSTNEGLTITGMTEARFALGSKFATGATTVNVFTVPASSTELSMIKDTSTNTDVDVRGIVIGDLATAGWSSS